MYGKRSMITASPAAEWGPAIDVPDELPYVAVGTPPTTDTVVLLIALPGAVTQAHLATPHWLNVCVPGTITSPLASKVRPAVVIADVGYHFPSSSGMKYVDEPRGVVLI